MENEELMLIPRVMFHKVSKQTSERIVKLDDFSTKIEIRMQ